MRSLDCSTVLALFLLLTDHQATLAHGPSNHIKPHRPVWSIWDFVIILETAIRHRTDKIRPTINSRTTRSRLCVCMSCWRLSPRPQSIREAGQAIDQLLPPIVHDLLPSHHPAMAKPINARETLGFRASAAWALMTAISGTVAYSTATSQTLIVPIIVARPRSRGWQSWPRMNALRFGRLGVPTVT